MPATFTAKSAQFSGDGFSDMHFIVHAVAADDFTQWVAARAQVRPDARPHELTTRWRRKARTTEPFTYRAIDPTLFDAVVTQKIPPGPGPNTSTAETAVRPIGGR